MKIGNFKSVPSHAVFIIAEIGINHEGSVEQCATMIEQAAAAGADAIKLQTVDADENYVVGTESYDLFKASALSRDETARMFDLARSLGVEPFTTVGDYKTLDWVEKLDPPAYKISSGLLTHTPLLKRIAAYSKPLLISSGMATEAEIDAAVNVARQQGNDQVTLFQCTSLYPAPVESLHLSVIPWMADRWGTEVGFSDHSLGDEAAQLAVAAGAVMLEKHFTLDSARTGFDHGISLEPDGFKKMVAAVRRVEQIMGNPEKVLDERLGHQQRKFTRCLVARQNIEPGDLFNEDNLAVKRPLPDQRGLEPSYYDRVLGRRSKRILKPDEPVSTADVEALD